jgi:hypothetical protein
VLLLATTSDLLRLVTSAAVTTDVHASWSDLNGTTVTPGRTNTPITTATTTTVVAAPASSTYRTVKTLTVRNRHASSPQTVTVVHTDGTNAMELVQAVLSAGDALHYDEHQGFTVRTLTGAIKQVATYGSAAVSAVNLVTLGSDVTNNNGTANTIQDVTGLSFPVNGAETYWFEFVIPYTSAATTTGSRWAINGPGSPTLLSYCSEYTLTATSQTVNYANTYDAPAASNASSLTAGNVAVIYGIITPSASGTVIARFASEVLSSAIVAKTGATLRWVRVL